MNKRNELPSELHSSEGRKQYQKKQYRKNRKMSENVISINVMKEVKLCEVTKKDWRLEGCIYFRVIRKGLSEKLN